MNSIKNFILCFTILFVLFCILNANGQEKIILGSDQEDMAHALTMFEGKYYIFGTTRKDAKSAKDYYLIQLRSNGSVERKITIEIPKHDVGNQVLVDEQGIFILGSTFDSGFQNVDMQMIKIDDNGEKEWGKFFGTQYQDLGFNFIRTRDGGFAMIGFSNSQIDGGDFYCVKTDNMGNVEWEKLFGPPNVDYGFSLVENEDGDFLFVGTKNGFYNPTQTEFSTHDADIMIVKIDKYGDEIWTKTYGGEGHDWAKDIIAAPGGGYFLSGSMQSYGEGSFDVFLMKIDEDGNELWIKTFGGAEYDYGEKLQMCEDGNICISGTSASFSENLNPDHFIVKTDEFGNEIWTKILDSGGSDYSSGLVATPDSGIVFTGWNTAGEIGKTDIVFYKLSKNGETEIISSISPFDSVRSVIIYPNPAKQYFTIEVISPINEKLDFILLDLFGRKVLKKKIETNEKNEIRNRNKNGIYFYKVESKNGLIQTGKLIIQN